MARQPFTRSNLSLERQGQRAVLRSGQAQAYNEYLAWCYLQGQTPQSGTAFSREIITGQVQYRPQAKQLYTLNQVPLFDPEAIKKKIDTENR